MRRYLIILSMVSIIALALTGCAVVAAEAQRPQDAGQSAESGADIEVLTFDMAEDFTRFAIEPDMVSGEGYPVHGNPFITQGYLYPAGTLEEGIAGVNPDGSPQFPDKVVGVWICYGRTLGDTMGAGGTPSAISTQYFELGEEYGSRTIVTTGYEFMQPQGPFRRAITGGTGEYRAARGEQIQEVLGANEYTGMLMRFELRLQR